LKMAAPSEEKLICDKFNLEALTVNQVKVSKLWQTGKMFSLEPKREVANRCHMRALPQLRCHNVLHITYLENTLSQRLAYHVSKLRCGNVIFT
jgi:hypothetical protein